MKRNRIKLSAVGALAGGMLLAQVAARKFHSENGSAPAVRRVMARHRMMKAPNLTDAR